MISMTNPTRFAPVLVPSYNPQKATVNPLDYIFFPKSVAVVGATEKEGSVGRTVLWNLISNPFGASIYPLNPNRPQVLGIRAYPKFSALPEVPELAVVCTAAKTVPDVVKEAVEARVKGMIIISAGFKEMGAEGEKMISQIQEYTRGTGIRIVGPNCLGVMCPLSGLNATFGAGMARPGSVAFISQSGALCTAILDWSFSEQVGFSAFVSIGSMIDVDWGDLIDYFGKDPRTSSIVLYMESVGDARSFLSAAREVAVNKPIIVIKAGRTAQAAKAAASHTGSLTGSDDVLDTAFKRAGVMRVDSIGDLFAMADVLAKQPVPRGPKVTIVTNAGGPGVLATDTLIQGGGDLTQLSEPTFKAFNELLPPHWSRNNPVDILGDAKPEVYAKALEIAAKDENADGMLVILTPQDMTDPTQTAEALKPYAKGLGKPVLASWMGGPIVEAGRNILYRAGIPMFVYPDMACKAFNYLWTYSKNIRALYETPETGEDPDELRSCNLKAQILIENVRKDGRTLLNEYESKKLLEAYGIPVVKTEIARSAEEAGKLAADFKFPVVLKLHSNTVTHKTDVGGVKLNLQNAREVQQAFEEIKRSVTEKAGAAAFEGVTVQEMVKMEGYEVILGSSVDPQFGPVLLFGSGGQLVEVYKDRALGLPPLSSTEARRMMGRTRIYKALQGVRGRKPVNQEALELLMVRFSSLVSQEPWIKEIDINPLLASDERIVALDARVLLHDPATAVRDLPRPAIRPYPFQYISRAKSKTGQEFIIRPIRAEDESRIVELHRNLGDQTVLMRYHEKLTFDERTAHNRLLRVCSTDYDRALALVACLPASGKKGHDSSGEIIGVCRYHRDPFEPSRAEFALVLADKWQGQGIGRAIMGRLIEAAREEGVKFLKAFVLADNNPALHSLQKLGFNLGPSEIEGRVLATLDL